MRVVGVLEGLGVDYGAIDVLPALQPLREVTTEISDWQTFPQLYVNGELVGGCDIVEEMLDSGELGELLGVEQPEDLEAPEPQRILPGRHADQPADAARLSRQRSNEGLALDPLGGRLPARDQLVELRAGLRSWRALAFAGLLGARPVRRIGELVLEPLEVGLGLLHLALEPRQPRLAVLARPARATRHLLRLARRRRRGTLGLDRRAVLGPAAVDGCAGSPTVDHDGAAADRLEQGAVVRDQQQRPAEPGERVLERLAALDVEVVGRLVEDQEVGVRVGQQREGQALGLAAGDIGEPLLHLVAGEQEAAEQRPRLRLREPGCVLGMESSGRARRAPPISVCWER